MLKHITFLLFSLLITSISYAQDGSESETHNENKIRHHWINLVSGTTFINGAISGEERGQILLIPTIGLDYEYKINHKFAVASVNDMELSSYVVEVDNTDELNRSYAFMTSVILVYDLFHFWGVYAGPGYEFEKHQNFFVVKIGTEFKMEFEEGWGLGISASLNLKDVNTSFTTGILIKKSLSKAK